MNFEEQSMADNLGERKFKIIWIVYLIEQGVGLTFAGEVWYGKILFHNWIFKQWAPWSCGHGKF